MTTARITAAVSEAFGIDPKRIRERTRLSTVVHARHAAFYIARIGYGWSWNVIGDAFGRDHATVISGVNRCKRRMEWSPAVQARVHAAMELLKLIQANREDYDVSVSCGSSWLAVLQGVAFERSEQAAA